MGLGRLKLCIGVTLFLTLLFSINLVVADHQYNCWDNTGDQTACEAISNCQWLTPAEDPWCNNDDGCCMDKGCWDFDATNQTACESNSEGYNCTWDSLGIIHFENGSQTTGVCNQNWESGNETWGGMSDGCWQYDGDKAFCGLNSCNWKPNDANQNTWCGVGSLTDAQFFNADATLADIGCCEQTGCWSYDGNESSCTQAFSGLCYYENSSFGPGWCMSNTCASAGANESQCNVLKNTLYMPCTFNLSDSGICEDSYGGGGFGAYNDTDSCFSNGGWYNSTGSCVTPTDSGGGSGGGGYLFGGSATCWFADNQPNVCGNVTGCAYCLSGSGLNGTGNSSEFNICSNKAVGYCEGRDVNDITTYDNANNSVSISCSDITLKAACKYGPLPNCKWENSSTNVGDYCIVGTSSERQTQPPVSFCEAEDSKNNYTLCTQLIEEFMMPCKWDNASFPVNNCTFNSGAVFGTGDQDFDLISSESFCTSAGGKWNTEYYVDAGILKQDSWCEFTGIFDIDGGGGEGNVGSCDSSCWACEFQGNGTAWNDVTASESACVGSALGYCNWTNSSSSFNGLGWCDYPAEMEDTGALDCNFECGGCDFMPSPEASCAASVAGNNTGCKWVNDTNNAEHGGFCVDKTKKICDSDCFSCFDAVSCDNSSLDCAWDPTFYLCSPNGYQGEICFDGVDNDADSFIDCADPDCGFDNFCGGSSVGGDCFAQTTEGEGVCNQTVAFSGLNCSWINDTWNPSGWCDMPGANCWTLDDDPITCGGTPGCTNDTSSLGTSGWCEMNWTQMDTATCWDNNNETACGVASDCSWTNNTWDGASTGSGWCDYAPFASCMGNTNSSTCSANSNCTWQSDSYSEIGGWCDIKCFDWDLNESACGDNSLCQWRNMSNTCQPSTFIFFGEGAGGGGGSAGGGCWSFDGNETACVEGNNSVNCQYKNDSYANNNWSANENPGWCMSKGEYEHFGEMEGSIFELGFDSGNVNEAAEAGVSDEIDLVGMGMRVTDEGFNFGAKVFNMSDSIICNGHYVNAGPTSAGTLGTGNSSGSFYWYLDTDGNTSNGCIAYGGTGDTVNETGYDFMIKYTETNGSNVTSGVVETKQLMRCVNSTSSAWGPTNALVTTSKQMSCGEIGGVMVAIASQDLEGYATFDLTANMRIFMTSVNNTDTRTLPSDYIGPGYYTPGTIDFAFVDCSDPDSTDPKCKNIQKFGFNVFEECQNGEDDDENGLIDCADPMCLFTPKCASGTAFSFDTNSSDLVAPTVTYNDVEELSDAAFFRIDTNEPSSFNLTFYNNDSTCVTLNATITDSGAGYLGNATYKPFHDVDLIDQGLVNGTTYYYKTKTCDPSGNCAISACSNFTTKTSTTAKSFIFKMDLPDGFTVDIPALNKTGYNFTETFTINGVDTVFEVGIKTNTSVTRNMNMTFHCGDMAIGFFGMNVLSPINIDLSSGFVCDEASDYIGMNSSLKKWNKLIDELHMGGATDYVEITLPVAYSASNTLNWGNDIGASGLDVDAYVECSGTTNTTCKIPVSMGFSTYTVTVPTVDSGDSGSSSGGGGGGGGGFWSVTYSESDTEFSELGTATRTMLNKTRIRIKLNEVMYYIGVTNFDNNSATATINVTNASSEKVLSVLGASKFDLDVDGLYDVLVTLNSVSSNSVNVTLDYISEVAPDTDVGDTSDDGAGITGDAVSDTSGDSGGEGGIGYLLILGILVLVAVFGGVAFFLYKKNR